MNQGSEKRTCSAESSAAEATIESSVLASLMVSNSKLPRPRATERARESLFDARLATRAMEYGGVEW